MGGRGGDDRQFRKDSRGSARHDHELRNRWPHFANMILGCWLISSPFTIGYQNETLAWNDLISGFLLLGLAGLSVEARRAWARWAASFLGFWIMFAPLALHTSSSGAYTNGTLIGCLVIVFSVIVPYTRPASGSGVPPGWTYNPATWSQRAPIIVIGFLGFFGARYMAAFQLGHLSGVWDPFFGEGTKKILTSTVSKAFPVPDAGLGAIAYLMECLTGFMGNTHRWRTMPWMVLFFGLLVIPTGVTSIVLVILQPVAVGEWCTLCLLTAAMTVITVPPALDEVIATFQFLSRARRRKASLWKTFWFGQEEAETEPEATEVKRAPLATTRRRDRFFPWPWHLYLATGVGIWLMAAPAVLGLNGAASDNSHLTSAVVVTAAIVAMAEVGRSVRLLNVLAALWLIASTWYLSGDISLALPNILAGVALILLSLPRGRVQERHGTWDRYII